MKLSTYSLCHIDKNNSSQYSLTIKILKIIQVHFSFSRLRVLTIAKYIINMPWKRPRQKNNIYKNFKSQ